MLPIYLAGASRELDYRVQPVIDKLNRSGVVRFTYPWWEAVRKHGVGNDHTLSNEQRRMFALRALTGVDDAALFWLLFPDDQQSTGALVELGRAQRGRAAIVVTGRSRVSIFASLGYESLSDNEGLAHVLGVARAYQERQ